MRFLLPLIAVLALATPTLAQPAGDPHHPEAKAAAAPSGPQGMMGMMQGMMRCPMAGRTEGTLAFLKAELNIPSAQTQTWNAFASAYRDVAGSRGSMMGEGMMGEGMMGGAVMGADGKAAKPLPDRLVMHTQMMERRLAAAKKLQAAIEPLYAKLDAKQKKTADQVMPMIAMMAVM